MEFFTAQNLTAFLTLLALEVVLGIDNVIFIAILSAKLPEKDRAWARQLGIALAVISRVILLFTISYLMNSATKELFWGLSLRDFILLVGGLFLIGKSTYEIHEKLEGHEGGHAVADKKMTFSNFVIQVMIIDIVFSLDSVITAVGIAEHITTMIVAIVVAAVIMIWGSGTIAHFVEKHPTLKILALAFLILIGMVLVFEGWNPDMAHQLHLKNYVYFAMAFAVFIEMLNIRLRAVQQPLVLHGPHLPDQQKQVGK